jgi:hypothetical protein
MDGKRDEMKTAMREPGVRVVEGPSLISVNKLV